jgi:7-carboxy-7-deazaguanine synthase
MGLDEILLAVEGHPARLVELTGGEPLLQPGALTLMRQLADRGWTVLLETGGSLELAGLDPRVVRIVDVKCPSSGESERNLWSNLAVLRAEDEVKFVLADRADFDYAVRVVEERLRAFGGPVLFSPVWGRLEPATLARWILESGLSVRLQLQLHKLLWPSETRGV